MSVKCINGFPAPFRMLPLRTFRKTAGYFARTCSSATISRRKFPAFLSSIVCASRIYSARNLNVYVVKRTLCGSPKVLSWYDDPTASTLPDLRLFPPENIRNFSIVAHVDHGKSTLADRLLEMTGTITAGSHNHQVLDRLEVERERGITVKAQTASLFYVLDGKTYLLNLIDTPGHVDFNYEVQRSLAACQGVLLLVDANQGVQAQTLATFYSAFEAEKTIIPVLNKIDLKNANPEAVTLQMQKAIDVDPKDVLKISAKLGTGVLELLHAIVHRIPPPQSDLSKPFKGQLFDSWYDTRRGCVALVAVIDGELHKGDFLTFAGTMKSYEVRDIGLLRPEMTTTKQLFAGQVGYIICNMKSTKEAQIGDTIFLRDRPVEIVTAMRKAKPMDGKKRGGKPESADVVAAYIRQRQYPSWTSFFLSRFHIFAGIFPEDQSENESLRFSLDKLSLNDSSVSVELEHSPALGQGWRLGFLGLLHMEVFLQRLEYEHGATCIATTPSVPYKAKLKFEKTIKELGGEVITIVNPENMPEAQLVEEFSEPWVIGTIISPSTYMGELLSICMERRGIQKNVTFLDDTRLMMQFYLPLSEVIVDFFDVLKSKTSGYASFDYEDAGYRPVRLTKVDYLMNGKVIPDLSMIVPLDRARAVGKRVCERLKETVPNQQFPVMIQAAVGAKIIAREDLKALRKDVVAQKIYSHGHGGDQSRKLKLLKRQKEGKERMRMVGNIEVPRDCFVKVLRK